jgi:hypothetical protein
MFLIRQGLLPELIISPSEATAGIILRIGIVFRPLYVRHYHSPRRRLEIVICGEYGLKEKEVIGLYRFRREV